MAVFTESLTVLISGITFVALLDHFFLASASALPSCQSKLKAFAAPNVALFKSSGGGSRPQPRTTGCILQQIVSVRACRPPKLCEPQKGHRLPRCLLRMPAANRVGRLRAFCDRGT